MESVPDRPLKQGKAGSKRETELSMVSSPELETDRFESVIKGLYAGTIFLGSFLLFLVQPMIAKMILPWFGGTSAVWITCVLFFQLALLGGYVYAHLLSSGWRPVRQVAVHAALLGASLFLLPISPSPAWKNSGSDAPSLTILCLLLITIGLPYFLLSTSSPLLQSWYVGRYRRVIPYRFFALSNLASLMGLVSYPFLIEPAMTLRQQARLWSTGYGIFLVLTTAVCIISRRNRKGVNDPEPVPEVKPCTISLKEKGLWLSLSACSSVLLLATTDHLLQNIASIPLLWILPLSLYLLSFIICFDRAGWYNRRLFFWLSFLALAGMSYGLGEWGVGSDIRKVVAAYCSGMFICCMMCHGELARRKPDPQRLTSFYLYVSLGGALGSMLVVLAAPLVFPFHFELPLGLLFCAGLLLAVNYRSWWVTDVACAAVIVRLAIVAVVYMQYYTNPEGIRSIRRNFYGHQRVIEYNKGSDREYRSLIHGTITHGIQFMAPGRRSLPTTYYAKSSGVGLAVSCLSDSPRRVGIIGLGAGTLATYARPGDIFTFFEINPQVLELASREFTFLSGSRGGVDVKMGDGRLLLEQEPNHQFDLLVVDAFSGDSIPVHLLTLEAIRLYFDHLKPGGIAAFNVSNLYLDLTRVLGNAGAALGKRTVAIVNHEEEENNVYQAEWVLMTSEPALFDVPAVKAVATPVLPRPDLRLWTDDYSNLLQTFQ